MSAISLKSITGITSITTPAGVDDQLTLHNNNTTEAVKLDIAGNLHFHNHLNITGISTAANFKTGTSNLHSTGLNVQDLDVDGHTNLDNVSIAGVTTMSGALIAEGNFIEIKGTMPYLALTDTNSNPDYSLFNLNGVFSIYDGTNSANRLTISSSGNVSIPLDLDVDGHTNLDNVSVAGVTTMSSTLNVSGVTNLSAELRANANIRMTNAGPKITFIDDNHNPDYEVGNYDGVFRIRDTTNSANRIAINSAGAVAFDGGVINLGTVDTSSGHLNSYELMTFNIDTDNDDTNRYFAFYKNGASGSGTELFKIQESGQITHTNFSGIGLHMSGASDPTIRVQDTDGTNQYGDFAHNAGDTYIVTRNNTSHGEFVLYSYNGTTTLPRIKISNDGTWTKYLNSSSTPTAVFGGTGQINGITAVPSSAGNPLVVGRDTGSLRSATFGGHLNFTSGYGIQGTEFSVYGNTSGLYLNSNVSGDAIIFQTHNGSSVGERLRIDGSGRLHIGSSNNTGSNTKFVVGAGNNLNTTAIINTGDVDTDALTLSNWDGSTTTNKVMIHFDSSGRGGFNIGMPAAADAFVIEDDGGAAALYIDSSNSVIIGNSTYGAAGSFSVGANGTFRSMLASGTAQDTLIGAISGVSNGFQYTTDSSNKQTYKFHSGTSQLVTITEQSDRAFPTVLIGDGNNGNTYFGDYYHSGAGSRITLGTNYSGAGLVLSYNCKPAATNATTWVSSQNAYSDKRSSLTMGGNGYYAFALYTSDTASQNAVGNTVSMDQKFAIRHDGKLELRGIGTCDNYGTGTTATHTVEDNGEVKLGNVARDQRRHSPTDFGRIKAMRSPNVLDWGLDRKDSSYQDGDGIGGFQGTYNVAYSLNGTSTQNRWVIGSGPGGGTEWLWSGMANGGRSNDQGGWNISGLFLNPAYSYVFINFVKRVSSANSGSYYMGTGGIGTLGNGAPSLISNPYWNCPGTVTLPQNVWCVDYRIIHSYYYDETTPAANEGMYRMDTGAQITGQNHCGNGNGYKFADTSTGIRAYGFRSYLFYATADSGVHLQWAQPHCYKIDGYEPKLSEVLETHTSDNASSWTGA